MNPLHPDPRPFQDPVRLDVSAPVRCASVRTLNLNGCYDGTDVSALAGCASLYVSRPVPVFNYVFWIMSIIMTFNFQVSTFNMQLSSFNMQLSSEFSTLRVRLVTSVLLLYFECLTPTVIQSCVINLKVEVHFEVWNFEVWSWKFWTTKYFELWTFEVNFELTLKHELWRLRCSLNWNVWKWTNSFNLIFYRCKARVTIKFVRSLLYGPSIVSGVCWLASLLTSESVWLAGLFD